MNIVEALNIVSGTEDWLADDGGYKPEIVNSWQLLVDSGIVGHLSEWYRFYARYMIDNEVVCPPQNDPNFIRSSAAH